MSYRRGRFGGSGFGGPKPVESGKEYDVQVTEISRKGDRFATAETIDGGEQQQVEQHQSTEQSKDVVSPPIREEEKPELQDYASSEAEEIKPEEQPPTG